MSSNRPTNPPSPRSSRSTSVAHAPTNPSSLRESHTIAGSPEEQRHASVPEEAGPSSTEPSPNTYPTHPATELEEDGGIAELGSRAITETTALLKKPFEFIISSPHSGPCNHGTFSPRLESRAESVRSGQTGYSFGGSPNESDRPYSPDRGGSIFGSLMENIGMKNGSGERKKKKMSTTSYLAERHGITNTTSMYVPISSILKLR
jgi:hypothetical protein